MIDKIKQHSDICAELTALYERKNHDYGDSFSQNFAEFGMMYGVMHMKEKLDRVKSLSTKDALVDGENINDSLLDLANYAILTLIERGYEPVTVAKQPVEPDLWDSLKHDQTCMRDCPECQCNKCANDHYGCCTGSGHSQIRCPMKGCPGFKPEKKVE